MNSTVLFARLSRPSTTARKFNPTTKQVLFCTAGVLFLLASVWALASFHLTDAQFVLGMLVSVMVSLAFIVGGFVAAVRARTE